MYKMWCKIVPHETRGFQGSAHSLTLSVEGGLSLLRGDAHMTQVHPIRINKKYYLDTNQHMIFSCRREYSAFGSRRQPVSVIFLGLSSCDFIAFVSSLLEVGFL